MFGCFSSGFGELCLCLKMLVQPVFTNEITRLVFLANQMKTKTSCEVGSRLFPALFLCQLACMNVCVNVMTRCVCFGFRFGFMKRIRKVALLLSTLNRHLKVAKFMLQVSMRPRYLGQCPLP